MRSMSEVADPERDDRTVRLRAWYPAVAAPDQGDDTPFIADAAPDTSGGPYPVILSSSKVATILAPYLVSHGFAWISVDGIDGYPRMNLEMIDQPKDLLLALDVAATDPPPWLKGMLDTDRAGVIGYSFDGYNALALSGARIDETWYEESCTTPDATITALDRGLSAFSCEPLETWQAYVARAGAGIAPGEDGLWAPMTDDRILAAMPMAAEGWWLFGERGLAAVDRPVLMLAADGDDLYDENALIHEHLGTPNRTFISFLGQDHMMIFDPTWVERMAHLAVAFFGRHLQGREELASQYSATFVAGRDELAWGVLPAR
jgi:predicted dienelactone hydrolase